MLLDLFISFVQIGLFSVGGGYVAIPLIQSQAVTVHAWMTAKEFADLVTIAEMTPGPIAINAATFVGMRMAGIGGALAATAGCILPSCVLCSVLFAVYRRCRGVPVLDSVLSCLRPVVVALIAGATLSILQTALFTGALALNALDVFNALLFVAAFVILRRQKCSPIAVIALCGALSLLGHWVGTRFL